MKKLDSSEKRKHAAAAISSGSARRAWIDCGTAPSEYTGRVIGVRTLPGAIAFTRTLSAPASSASWRENAMMPPFAAA